MIMITLYEKSIWREEPEDRGRESGVCVCVEGCYVAADVCLSVEGEEDESTGFTFIHFALKQHHRSTANKIRL